MGRYVPGNSKWSLELQVHIHQFYLFQAYRSGLRVGDLISEDFEQHFATKFRQIASDHMRAFNIEFDVENEIEKYRQLAEEIRPYVCETVSYLHEILSSGKKVLVEGANASMLDIGT